MNAGHSDNNMHTGKKNKKRGTKMQSCKQALKHGIPQGMPMMITRS